MSGIPGLLLKTIMATDPGVLRGLLQVTATSEPPRDFHDQAITVRGDTVQRVSIDVYMLQKTL